MAVARPKIKKLIPKTKANKAKAMNPLIQDLGVGVGLRPAHHFHFLNEKPKSARWIEVISENYMPWKGNDFRGCFTKSIDTLLKIRRDYPVALHGVSMNLGSVDSLNLVYMKRLKKLVDQVNPFAVSDHLSWTGVNSQNLHDLLPVPYSVSCPSNPRTKGPRV